MCKIVQKLFSFSRTQSRSISLWNTSHPSHVLAVLLVTTLVMTIGMAGTAYATVITNDIRLIPISSVFDGQDGFDALLGANDIEIVTISGDYYL